MSRVSRLVCALLLASVAARAQAEPVAPALGAGHAIARPLREVLRVGAKLMASGLKPVKDERGTVKMYGEHEDYLESWSHGAHGSVGYLTSYNLKKHVEHTITLTLDDRGRMTGATSTRSLVGRGTKDTHHVLTERIGAGGQVVRTARLYTGESPTRTLGKHGVGEGAFEESRISSAPLAERGFAGHNQLVQHMQLVAPAAGEAPKDVALGKEYTPGRATLDQFGATIGASIYRTWGTRGLATHGSAAIAEFAERFHDAMKTAISRGGRIKYDLTGIDIARAKTTVGDAVPNKGITAWELRQVLSHPEYLAATDFYLQGKDGAYQKLDAKDLDALGIK
jgi:hypothetical protein